MKKQLTNLERRVLFGLVRYPETTIRGLAELLKMKLSTVKAYGARLEKANYYTSRRVFNMGLLRDELIVFAHANFVSSENYSQRLRASEEAMNQPQIVFSISSPSSEFLILFARSLTEAQEVIAGLEQIYWDGHFIEEQFQLNMFSYKTSTISNFFDYSRVLALHFVDVVAPDEVRSLTSVPSTPVTDSLRAPVTTRPLSPKETVVIRGLLDYPDTSDLELSRRVVASRATIGRIRKEFTDSGMLRKMNIPFHEKLGFNLMVVTSASVNMKIMEGMKEYLHRALEHLGPSILTIFGRFKFLTIHLYPGDLEFRRALAQFESLYDPDDIFIGAPTRLVFSISSSKWRRYHRYADVLKHRLNHVGS